VSPLSLQQRGAQSQRRLEEFRPFIETRQ
jgi:hypothetical protein